MGDPLFLDEIGAAENQAAKRCVSFYMRCSPDRQISRDCPDNDMSIVRMPSWDWKGVARTKSARFINVSVVVYAGLFKVF